MARKLRRIEASESGVALHDRRDGMRRKRLGLHPAALQHRNTGPLEISSFSRLSHAV